MSGKWSKRRPDGAVSSTWFLMAYLDVRTGALRQMEWWPADRLRALGVPVDAWGPELAGLAGAAGEAPGERPPAAVAVGYILARHGIDTNQFGRGVARTLDDLTEEIRTGASRLMLDASAHKKLVRVVDLVLLRVAVGTGDDADELVLVELGKEYSDGRAAAGLERLPATKREPHESTKRVVDRMLAQIFGQGRGAVRYSLQDSDVFETEDDSASYPGVRTVYRKELVKARRPDPLRVGSRVFIYGLTSPAGRSMNFRAGRVASAASPGDRSLFLCLQTLHHSREMRVARPALGRALHDDCGLLLLVWDENWCFSHPERPLALSTTPAALPRLDSASADMGLGRVLFAGGCGQHPRRCTRVEDFFKSAEVYDSLTNEWSPIADMPTRRHGASACLLGARVYVLGGAYVDERDADEGAKFCDVLDTETMEWSSIPPSHYSHVVPLSIFQRGAAFFGSSAIGGRLVVLLENVTLAYNPSTDDGWRRVEAEGSVAVGHSSCACAYEGELLVASGRPERFSRSVAAFSFTKPACDKDWWCGRWRQLPDLNKARVGGAMAVVHGRLYITGGVDEDTGVFCDCAERLEKDRWAPVPWFRLTSSVQMAIRSSASVELAVGAAPTWICRAARTTCAGSPRPSARAGASCRRRRRRRRASAAWCRRPWGSTRRSSWPTCGRTAWTRRASA
ncbi:unnamed protein product, partial [Prorocentrum cordatum]